MLVRRSGKAAYSGELDMRVLEKETFVGLQLFAFRNSQLEGFHSDINVHKAIQQRQPKRLSQRRRPPLFSMEYTLSDTNDFARGELIFLSC